LRSPLLLLWIGKFLPAVDKTAISTKFNWLTDLVENGFSEVSDKITCEGK
jgi:hypothetical protein